jgi:hypothetical protein
MQKRPLGKQVIEIGTGIGNFAQWLLIRAQITGWSLVEPGKPVATLHQRFFGAPRVTVL